MTAYTIRKDKVWFTLDCMTDLEAEWKWFKVSFLDKYYPNWRENA